MAGGMSVRNLWTSFKAKTEDFDRGMDRAKKKTDDTKRSMVDAGQQGAKAASIAGAGFSALSAGISAGAATAENFEASMVSAAAATAAAFGAGGPIGAALALAAIGIGTLVSLWKSAGKEAEESKKKQVDAANALFDEASKSAKEYEKIQLDIRELQAQIAGEKFDRKAWEAKRDIGAMRDLVSDRERDASLAERKAKDDLARYRRAMGMPQIVPANIEALLKAQEKYGISVREAQGAAASLEALQLQLNAMEQRQSMIEDRDWRAANPAEAARRDRQMRGTIGEGYDPREGSGRSRIIEVQERGNGFLKRLVDVFERVESKLGTAR